MDRLDEAEPQELVQRSWFRTAHRCQSVRVRVSDYSERRGLHRVEMRQDAASRIHISAVRQEENGDGLS